MTLAPETEAAAGSAMPAATPEDYTLQPGQDAGDPIQKEADADLIDKLTDIPEVARYASRVGATHRSLNKLAVIASEGQYKRDLAVIVFGGNGEITAPDEYAPDDAEASAIKEAWKRYRRPAYQPCLFKGRDEPLSDPRFPWWEAAAENISICWDAAREHILCVEERRDRDDGKDIFIWSYFEDGKWRIAEPPDGLPLFGLDRVKGAGGVMVHEGPKCAKAARGIAADHLSCDDPRLKHPWRDELRGGGTLVHIAFLGGAYRAGQARWGDLAQAGFASVTVMCDNDQPGGETVIPISRAMRRVHAIMFDDRFPPSFDIADPLPASMYDVIDDQRVWRGPKLADLRRNVTWATRRLPNPDNPDRSHFVVREEFAEGWFYVGSPGVFVSVAQPSKLLKPKDFNIDVRHISDVEETDKLFWRLNSRKGDKFIYDPGKPTGVATSRDGRRAFNSHKRTGVKPLAGDYSHIDDFFSHLITDEFDRMEVKRWVATIIACPGRRMAYGLILASNAKGIGKSWTAEKILAPLVGKENASFPTEQMINDKYTDWYAEKRLVAIEEVSVGDKRQFADKLKAPVTQDEVAVRKMFLSTYYLDNFAHFIITSNDDVPMPIEQGDRRWLIPALTTEKRPPEYWRGFHSWLQGDGLGIVMHWAINFVREHGAVEAGAIAPMTERKARMMSDSVFDVDREMEEVAEAIAGLTQPDGQRRRAMVLLSDVQAWLAERPAFRGKKVPATSRIAGIFRKAGLTIFDSQNERPKIAGKNEVVAINFAKMPGDKWPAIVSDCRLLPANLFETPY